MSAPLLTTKITLQARVRSPDGSGGFSEIWTDLGILWGALERSRGSKVTGQEIPLSRARYRVIVRAAPVGAASRPEVAQRFAIDGQIFNILSVLHHDQGQRFLACEVEEEIVG
ncbi:MAG: head-tail adaptor protein [Pseudomonadota bacterium]